MKEIHKKIRPEYFEAVVIHRKRFELRKDENNVQPGDDLVLREWTGTEYTGRAIRVHVTYVLRNAREYGLMEGYCIIGF